MLTRPQNVLQLATESDESPWKISTLRDHRCWENKHPTNNCMKYNHNITWMSFTPPSTPDNILWIPAVTAEDSPELVSRPSTEKSRQMFQ